MSRSSGKEMDLPGTEKAGDDSSGDTSIEVQRSRNRRTGIIIRNRTKGPPRVRL